MSAELSRFFCVDAIRRVDDLPIDRQLPDIVEITRDRCALDLVRAPAKLFRDDLGIFPDTDRMSFGVTVLAIDRRGECANGVAVRRLQGAIEFSVLIGLPLEI